MINLKHIACAVFILALVVLIPVQCQSAQDSGVRLRLTEKPTFINAAGEPFIAKGVTYYQPTASHHYFLKALDLERVSNDLKKFQEVGFNTILVDVGWGELFIDVDPKNNYAPVRINKKNVEKLKTLAKIARQEGFYIYVLPGIQRVPPQVLAKEYPASTDDDGNFHPSFKGYFVYNWLVDESVNKGFATFVEFIGETLRPFDNILCYALYYELMSPQFPSCRDNPILVEKWRQYLRDRNPDVNYWKKRWNEEGHDYKSIDEIPLPYHDRDHWRIYFEKVLKMQPRESHPLAWRDCYDFMMVAIGYEGRYGLSFGEIAKAIRRGDPDALISWKTHNPIRYAWELGCLEEFRAGKTPAEAENILKKIYAYPGIDIIACDGYPTAEKDPAKRAYELTFKRNFEHAEAIKEISPLPLYCQEFGINHYQWLSYECEEYLTNAIKGYQELGAIGYNIWQSHDFCGGTVWDRIQPNFGIFDINSKPHQAVKAIASLLGGGIDKKASKLPGLYVENGKLMRKGKPYRAIGVNYFDAFYRTIKNPGDKSYKKGFAVLRDKYEIPFIRFMAGGYWPIEWKLYFEDKQKYFELMDEFVAEAEKQNLGLIPSLFWYVACVPDIVGEPMDQLGNPDSKTIEFIKTYTREMVSRYVNSPAIWAWEFGNEHILAADILKDDSDTSVGVPQIVPELGTATVRTDRDRIKRTDIRAAYRIFSDDVRKLDPHRIISTGNATTPKNSYHRYFENNWDIDSQQQWKRMLICDNPGSVNSVSIHVYPDQDKAYFPEKVDITELIGICNETAKIEDKPLFVGEFGAPKTPGPEKEKEIFFKVLNAIEQHKVPLAAVWVFDYSPQDKDWNITAENDREYMLRAVQKGNERIQ